MTNAKQGIDIFHLKKNCLKKMHNFGETKS